MELREYIEKRKKEMGLLWYWERFKALFDLEHQYDMWMMRRHLYHVQKVNYWADRIAKRHED